MLPAVDFCKHLPSCVVLCHIPACNFYDLAIHTCPMTLFLASLPAAQHTCHQALELQDPMRLYILEKARSLRAGRQCSRQLVSTCAVAQAVRPDTAASGCLLGHCCMPRVKQAWLSSICGIRRQRSVALLSASFHVPPTLPMQSSEVAVDSDTMMFEPGACADRGAEALTAGWGLPVGPDHQHLRACGGSCYDAQAPVWCLAAGMHP